MDKQQPRNHFSIIFVTGLTWTQRMQNCSRKAKWRLIRAKPSMCYILLGAWLQGFLLGTKIRHVTVTNGTVVIDHQYKSMKFWSHEVFISMYPNVIGHVNLPTSLPIDWKKYERTRKTSLFYATFARFAMLATFGIYQCDNCVTTARAVLEDVGIEIPRKAWHPRKLLSWLLENGYGFTPGPPPSYC